MRSYVLRRLLTLIPLLIGISIIAFVIMHLAPGDPALMFVDVKKGIDPAQVARVRHSLGLDQPVYVQYLRWLGQVVRGNWGYSFINPQPVMNVLAERLPNTLKLSGLALLLALVVSVPTGVISAVRQYSKLDYAATLFTFVGISVPEFWIGLMLMFLFSVKLQILPAVGMSSLNIAPGAWPHLVDSVRHYILPTVVLGFGSMATWTRYIRSSMLEAVRQDYVRTARAKGLSERVVLYKHALRNALIPPITVMGMTLPELIGGSYIIESIFAWPGMGRLGVTSIFLRDYPVVMGVTMMSALLVALGNLLADLAYAWADPRIRFR